MDQEIQNAIEYQIAIQGAVTAPEIEQAKRDAMESIISDGSIIGNVFRPNMGGAVENIKKKTGYTADEFMDMLASNDAIQTLIESKAGENMSWRLGKNPKLWIQDMTRNYLSNEKVVMRPMNNGNSIQFRIPKPSGVGTVTYVADIDKFKPGEKPKTVTETYDLQLYVQHFVHVELRRA